MSVESIRHGIAIAGLLAALAIVIAWDTSNLTLTSTYGVGPKAMPIVVAIGLAILAVGNFIIGMKGDLPTAKISTTPPSSASSAGLPR